jgi:Ser/Thr protein kinase RdoA (MazF antagonist)
VDVDALARSIDPALHVIGRPAAGVSGAVYDVRDGNDRALILKLAGSDLDVERAATTCARLRRRGYPAPVVVRTGRFGAVDYILSERLPGEPMPPTTIARVPQVLALVDAQRGIGLPSRSQWVSAVVASVVGGRVGYCEHEPLRTHSDETRALLGRLFRIADATDDDFDVPTADIVHFDLSHANVLSVDGEAITGVIDWEGTTTGDAAFDLVTHALYTYELDALDALLTAAADRTDTRVLALYAAHMVLRQVSWSLRNADDFTIRWWLDLGTALLDAVGAE